MIQKNAALAPTRTRQKTSFPSRATKWSQAEDDLLIQLVRDNPKVNWNEISPKFPGKTAQQISERWSKVVNPDLVKGSWTRQEDELIIDFVHRCGTKNWTKLASLLPGRIGKQCRERWRNHLDPSNNHGAWTPEEDALLIQYHNQFGNAWVKIAALMPGRSDNSIKNRWNSTLRKYPHQQAPHHVAVPVHPPEPMIECVHTTPVNDIATVVAPPTTPSSVEPLPRPQIEDTETFDQQPSGLTPRAFELISPYCIRSPFNMVSPFIRTPTDNSLLSPWGESLRTPTESLFSPKFSPLVRRENREPNLSHLILDKE